MANKVIKVYNGHGDIEKPDQGRQEHSALEQGNLSWFSNERSQAKNDCPALRKLEHQIY